MLGRRTDGIGAVLKTLLFPLLLIAGSAGAAAVPDALKQALENGVQNGAYRDVAAGFINGNQRATLFLGAANADSSFEIGATTEVFTGVLLAQAAIEGKLRLHMPLRELLPDIAIADPTLAAATPEALITHHAGLPAVPPNLFPSDIEDAYANYTEATMRAWLANWRADAASTDYAYSTLDAGLLGYAVSRRYAARYPDLLRDKVLLPLHLTHTAFDDDHLLAGHARGQDVPHWHFGALAGSAGLRSNLDDLLDFLQINLRPEKSPLRAALLLARQPRARRATGQLGFGWNIHESGSGDQTWPLLWRASTTAGFSTFIGFRTDRQQALVLMGDTDADLSALGIALLDERALPPTPLARKSMAAATRLDDYVGLYQVRGSGEITIRVHDGRLFAQPRGAPASPLNAVADDVYDATADRYTLSFQREAGHVNNLIFSQAGINVLAERLSEHAPHVARAAIALDAKTLAEFTGDYRLSSTMLARIATDANHATWQLTARSPVALVAFAKDRFACADDSCELVFHRGNGGALDDLTVDFAGAQHEAPRVNWNSP